jgi:large subunit ribosomal protein L6
MSRIGKLPIILPKEVKVNIDTSGVRVSGPKGQLHKSFSGNLSVNLTNDNKLSVVCNGTSKFDVAMHGTVRSLLNNMVLGVTNGFTREIEILGTGYQAAVKGDYLVLKIYTSHDIRIEIPPGISVSTPKHTVIHISGIDKEQLGLFGALILRQKKVEPYKGKGIRYKEQKVLIKQKRSIK